MELDYQSRKESILNEYQPTINSYWQQQIKQREEEREQQKQEYERMRQEMISQYERMHKDQEEMSMHNSPYPSSSYSPYPYPYYTYPYTTATTPITGEYPSTGYYVLPQGYPIQPTTTTTTPMKNSPSSFPLPPHPLPKTINGSPLPNQPLAYYPYPPYQYQYPSPYPYAISPDGKPPLSAFSPPTSLEFSAAIHPDASIASNSNDNSNPDQFKATSLDLAQQLKQLQVNAHEKHKQNFKEMLEVVNTPNYNHKSNNQQSAIDPSLMNMFPLVVQGDISNLHVGKTNIYIYISIFIYIRAHDNNDLCNNV